MNNAIVLGVDIGGSHITVAFVDVNKGALVEGTLVRKMVNSQGTKEEVINDWCAAINACLASKPNNINTMGIAMPGPFDYENGISLIQEQPKYRSLFGVNVKELLARQLNFHQDNIKFINDACSFLQGEVLAGAVKDMDGVIGITLGTGLGSATYTVGGVVDADLWQMPFQSGIAEDYLSTRWFVKEYHHQFEQPVKGVKELVELAETNKAIIKIFKEFGENLAAFLIAMHKENSCSAVVIGGNISKAAHYFLYSANVVLEKEGVDLTIKIGRLGETAALIGAAGIFKNKKVEKNAA